LYRAFVRHKVLQGFAHMSRQDPGVVLSLMREDVRYTFEGEHALGGTRHSRASVALWFERLFRLLPGRFQVTGIEVVGWPWHTTVVTRFEDDVTPPVGPPYHNRGVQIAVLRWGKASEIHTYVDTAKVERALGALAEAGIAEASAPPIR
jgi:ketosteroid isomerase-like protein